MLEGAENGNGVTVGLIISSRFYFNSFSIRFGSFFFTAHIKLFLSKTKHFNFHPFWGKLMFGIEFICDVIW